MLPVPTIAQIFFGDGAALVLLSLLLFAFVLIGITAKVFGNALAPKENRVGMIMELPPYHKPKWGHIIRTSLSKGGDIFLRALKVITAVSLVFWLLSYSKTGDLESTIIYKIGTAIEPFTRIFGLGWQTFMAFIAGAISKEATLGVLGALFVGNGDIFSSTFAKSTEAAAGLNEILPQAISKAEALAFIFASTFNIPCLVALAATCRECHSVKWVIRISLYYIVMALCISFVVYHIGLVVF